MRRFEHAWDAGDFSALKVFLTLLLVLGGFLLGNFPLNMLYPSDGGRTMSDLVSFFGFKTLFILQMIPFFVGIVAFVISARFIHKTSIRSWISARPTIDGRRLLFSFGLWALLIIVPIMIDWYRYPTKYEFQAIDFQFFTSFTLLAICLPFQVFFEELMFRAFIFQGITKRTKSVFIAVLLSGVMFGLMHIGNPEVSAHGYGLLGIYIALGISISLMAFLDQGLEIAFGFHLANNFITGILVTSSDQAFQTHALLKVDSLDVSFASTSVLLLSLLLFLLICYRRFQWRQVFANRNNH